MEVITAEDKAETTLIQLTSQQEISLTRPMDITEAKVDLKPYSEFLDQTL